MASSGKRQRSAASAGLSAHVAARLKNVVRPGERLVLGLSGGVDSIVLLDVLVRMSARLGFRLQAMHVNHQLSPNAPAWARFCRAVCRGAGVPLRVVKVDVTRANSVERAAREARYAALLATRANHIVLAHNADDQAETVLLQLLRGAGVRGLAGMPPARSLASAATTTERSSSSPAAGAARFLLRPLLEIPRAEIERYARRRHLAWIEDESNADVRYTRNWLRREILPRIAQRVPAYREALTRAARNAADAAELIDGLAQLDAREAVVNDALHVDALRTLGPVRARNLLRHAIGARGWRMPDAARLHEALRQTLTARRDARVAVDLGDCELRRHGPHLFLLAREPRRDTDDAAVPWRGEPELVLAHLGGVLAMKPACGEGLSATRLKNGPVTVHARHGGERLQPAANRPHRTVKNLLQESKVPPWQRSRLPFIYCGDALVCVPGLATDYRFRAAPGEPSILPVWHAHAPPGH